jgi:diaminopimelate epimerase
MPAVAQTVSLVKMNGTGNDFVLLDERPQRFERYQEMARVLCDRAGPVGADGLLVLLRPSRHEPELEPAAALRIFNADGSEAETCGNGIRCVARYLWGQSEGRTRFTVETPAGPVVTQVEATFPEFRVRVDIGAPLILHRYAAGASIEFGGAAWRYAEVSTGNLHVVIFVDDVETIDLERMGASVSADSRFARGANVHVAHTVDRRTIRARHFERGVGITRACGSGAVAIAAAAIDDSRASSPLSVYVPGGVLEVEWRAGERAFLRGPVEVEFERTVLV